MVIVEEEPRVGVQLAPNHVPPDWPDGTPPQQMHLDLWVEDFPSAHERVMSLGAKVLKPAEETDSVDNFQVYADPAGIPSACAGSNGSGGQRQGFERHSPPSGTPASLSGGRRRSLRLFWPGQKPTEPR
jgi:hypothetical protein